MHRSYQFTTNKIAVSLAVTDSRTFEAATTIIRRFKFPEIALSMFIDGDNVCTVYMVDQVGIDMLSQIWKGCMTRWRIQCHLSVVVNHHQIQRSDRNLSHMTLSHDPETWANDSPPPSPPAAFKAMFQASHHLSSGWDIYKCRNWHWHWRRHSDGRGKALSNSYGPRGN